MARGQLRSQTGWTPFPACARLRVCAFINLSISGRFSSLQTWPSCWRHLGWLRFFFGIIYLPSNRAIKHKEVIYLLTGINFWSLRTCFFSLWMGFSLLVTVPTCALYQTVCAAMHRPVFCPIIWFFLITSILSLKCNYAHHVLFLVERHLVREAESNPSALAEPPPMENKNMLWRWVVETCGVSHYNGGKKQDFEVCIKQKSADKRPYVNSSVIFFLGNLDNLDDEPAYLTPWI